MSKRDIYKVAKAVGWTAFSVSSVASGSVLGSIVCIILARDWWEEVVK